MKNIGHTHILGGGGGFLLPGLCYTRRLAKPRHRRKKNPVTERPPIYVCRPAQTLTAASQGPETRATGTCAWGLNFELDNCHALFNNNRTWT